MNFTVSSEHMGEEEYGFQSNVMNNYINEVITDFVFSDKYAPALLYNSKLRNDLKILAFNIINDAFLRAHNEDIPNQLIYRENDEDMKFCKDGCLHFLIRKINDISNIVVEIVNSPKYKNSQYIFIPYVKQLKLAIYYFVNDYCCNKLVNEIIERLDLILNESNKYLDYIRLLHERVQVMNVFRDEIVLYTCNICHETSLEKSFLKPNECCGYSICYSCYANLWKFCDLYPVCPVCKHGFKKSN
ncbi:IE-0 [Adoxophyes honmai nucleopolyhedrovirus]|uniref:IE-0 n=1 Tax=Adoxophyes honmai nucleopolyhedrovirus TaxID=224399 RepID=Q80LS1_NPVAH|nr:IE-0 [Adoxophyes honmai nucleopolyhedrovirus]BAC67276.1 IE-0 [Adoxophyes honmai nucleopolyhedrovirus]